MSSTSFPVGVSAVLLPKTGASSLPSFAALTFTASGVTPTTLDNNSTRSTLDSTATYQVILAPLGLDLANGGYTNGVASPSSGNLTLTAGQGIQVSITSGNLSALGGQVAQMFAISVWIKTGAGNFVLTDHAYCDPSKDFVHMVVTAPRRSALSYTSAVLQSSTADAIIGSRVPYGCSFLATATTTGGITLNRTGDKVSFTPDNAGNFDAKTTRTVSIEFSVLSADLKDQVDANAGTYVRHTYNGTEYEEAQMSEYTAAVSVPGCKPVVMVQPPDTLGFQAVTCFLGQILQNQEDNTLAYTKDNQIETKYTLSAVPNDTLTNNMNTELQWKIRK